MYILSIFIIIFHSLKALETYKTLISSWFYDGVVCVSFVIIDN